MTRRLPILLLALPLLLASPPEAAADIYTYRTPDGETLITSEPRSDLELVEVIRSGGGGSTLGRSKAGGGSKAESKKARRLEKRAKNVARAKEALEEHRSKQAGVRRGAGPEEKVRRDQTFDDLISEASEAYDVPFHFIKAVIKVESSFNPRAISYAGAQGLMQLMPNTAKMLDVTDPFDPRQNVFGGTRLLRILIDRYDGDINLVLSAYNAGDRAVSRAKGIPFTATRKYVASIYRWYKVYQKRAAE